MTFLMNAPMHLSIVRRSTSTSSPLRPVCLSSTFSLAAGITAFLFCSTFSLSTAYISSIMKILYVGVYRQVSDAIAWRLASASYLSDFSYFTRPTIAGVIQFAGRTCVQRTRAGCRQSIQKDEGEVPFAAHVYVRSDGLAGIVMADKEYPARVAFALITKTLIAYEERVGAKWKQMDADQQSEPDFLQSDLVLYQDPRKADKLTAIQSQLDDVKDVMHVNIEQLLQRGETLDSLMDKSNDLGLASVQFLKQAKKANSCCKY